MTDLGVGKVGVAYAAAGAALSLMVMARGVWHSKPDWRPPLVFFGFLGLASCILVVLNILSVGDPR